MAGRRGSWLVTLPLAVLVIAVVLPFTLFAVGTWLAGYRLQPVLSGSMAPTYPVGSLLVVSPIDASQVEPGMAVTFDDPADNGRIVTHRVISRAPGDTLAFVTRGDANATDDPFPVPARSVHGRVLWSVPGLGTVVDALAWPRGFLVLVVIPGLLLVALELRGRLGGRLGGRPPDRPDLRRP
jgi:signal peptidase